MSQGVLVQSFTNRFEEKAYAGAVFSISVKE
jgi:hypothetical protein